MKPHSVGRTLGIGLRIAGRIAGQRAAAAATQSASGSSEERQTTGRAAQSRATVQAAGQVSKGIARGIGGFLRPFRSVGGKLMLEVTGAFFLLPLAVFAPELWRTKASYSHGPDHWTFVLSAALSVLFLYLSVSSFWRAWRK